MTMRDRIRCNLVSAMKSAGLSQVEFASKLKISKGTVNNWVKGNNSPDVEMIPKICSALGISIMQLFGESTQTLSESDSILIAAYHSAPQAIKNVVDVALEPYKPVQTKDEAM